MRWRRRRPIFWQRAFRAGTASCVLVRRVGEQPCVRRVGEQPCLLLWCLLCSTDAAAVKVFGLYFSVSTYCAEFDASFAAEALASSARFESEAEALAAEHTHACITRRQRLAQVLATKKSSRSAHRHHFWNVDACVAAAPKPRSLRPDLAIQRVRRDASTTDPAPAGRRGRLAARETRADAPRH